MPEQIRALVVVLILTAFVFALVRGPAGRIIGAADFRRWRNLWFAVTLVTFLAGGFWVYAVATSLFVTVALRGEQLRPALYLLLLLAVPQISQLIRGFGIINYFIVLSPARLLAILILVPAFVSVTAGTGGRKTRWLAADRFLLFYFALILALTLRGTSFTDTMRDGTMLILGMLLPYWVFSRSLHTKDDIKRTMLAYLLPVIVLAVLGLFESVWDWHLYGAVRTILSEGSEGAGYAFRSGALRATTTAIGPIVFGYTVMIGLGFLLAFSRRYLSARQRWMAFAALILGLVASLSRGPWVGAVVLIMVYLATGRGQTRTIARLGSFLAVFVAILSQTQYWDNVVGLIPFVGGVEAENVDYRMRLIENAWVVIQNNLWFGSVDFASTSEMQAMIQGEGIIDIVNSYIGVALSYGLAGLLLFVVFFSLVLRNLRKAYRSLPDNEEELRDIGRALFATLVAVLVTIGTVSSVGTIPMLYWSLAGISVAYSRLVGRVVLEKNVTSGR